MRSTLFRKLAGIAVVALLLLIPLEMIGSKIRERQGTRDGVISELSQSGVGHQRLAGPLLILPCREEYWVDIPATDNQQRKEKRQRDCTRTLVADTLDIKATLNAEDRFRGIYAARFFLAHLNVEGTFQIDIPKPEAGVERKWSDPILQISIGDIRGIKNQVSLQWNGAEFPFTPGSGDSILGPGVHAVLHKLGGSLSGAQQFSYAIDLQGLEGMDFVPSAKQMLVNLKSPWPHPSFVGRYLPEKPAISAQGFEANWRVSEFSSNAAQLLSACGAKTCQSDTQNGNAATTPSTPAAQWQLGETAGAVAQPAVACEVQTCQDLMQSELFGVKLIEPVDVYLKSSRAVTYGFLFVALTFAAFFLFEILKSLRVHPIQYGLVGCALAIFFLLLFSLAEHIAFVKAYIIAAASCIALIGFYVSFVLASARRGLSFSALLVALYTALYTLLRSEDHGLLLGTLLSFGMLAIIMVLTRRLNWYQVGHQFGKTDLQNPVQPA